MKSIDVFLARAISPSSVRADGPLTDPRSYGVYRLPGNATGRSFRFGNHPIRMLELEREFGACKLEYLFRRREDARAVALHLSGAGI
ncbi:MAG: hypothetical protein KDA57_18485 [Planctomycetales bacterium]|nr:hypothetical protein [Planctomycetales bacterium]